MQAGYPYQVIQQMPEEEVLLTFLLVIELQEKLEEKTQGIGRL